MVFHDQNEYRESGNIGTNKYVMGRMMEKKWSKFRQRLTAENKKVKLIMPNISGYICENAQTDGNVIPAQKVLKIQLYMLPFMKKMPMQYKLWNYNALGVSNDRHMHHARSTP